jgi:hypothetical protein
MASEHFDAVDAVFCRLADREEQRGSESIADVERVVLLVWHASGIIGNGGFRYFFECALPLPATAQAYERIGVEQAASILRRLQEFFPGRHIPDDYNERMTIVSRFYSEHSDLLSQLEREFYSTDALMQQQLAGWIRVHHDVFHVTDAA